MTLWKAPNRPKHEISQAFSDGIVNIYSVSDTAEPGLRPVKGLSPLYSLRYAELKLGIQRYYAGRQNQVNISRVIRVPCPPMEITNQHIAITEKNTQYRIDLVQKPQDVYPPCYDLTLTRISQEEEYPL